MKRYPIEPLLTALGMSLSQLNTRLRMNGDAYRSARDRGLTELRADRICTRFGLHPRNVWPDWLDDMEVECANDLCGVRFVPSRRGHRFHASACRNTFNERKARAAGAAWVQRKLDYRRRYYLEHGDYERARQRRYDQQRRSAA